MSAPMRHFDFLAGAEELDALGYDASETPDAEKRDDWRSKIRQADAIIVGGGGLLGIEFFAPSLRLLFAEKARTCPIVLWGAGHNSWTIADWRKLKYKIDLSGLPFDLVGIRDFDQGYDWVPCASCMSPLFDELANAPAKRDIGLFVHEGTVNNPKFNAMLPRDIELFANDSDFESVVTYLSESDTILTDSYHGMYWATLLGKKVVAFPTSSKFYDSKFPVPLCAPQDWKRFLPLAIRYPSSLSECRQANVGFAEKVKAIVSAG